MKEIKSTKKLSFSKKLLIKICRFLGYEVFDQRSLEFPAASKNNLNYLSTPGIKSFTLGLGQTNIKRKIECLDIVVKTCRQNVSFKMISWYEWFVKRNC